MATGERRREWKHKNGKQKLISISLKNFIGFLSVTNTNNLCIIIIVVEMRIYNTL